MISAKRLAQLAKKWQRLTATAIEETECCISVAVKGHCVMYTVDESRLEVPLVYLSTTIFRKILKMSQEEFGFASDGKITQACDAKVMEYIMCLLRRNMDVSVHLDGNSSILLS